MSTRTRTQTTHWHVQSERRDRFIEEWRQHRRAVVRFGELQWKQTPRRLLEAAYMGIEAGSPTRTIDATAHAIPPATTSTIHRHSWDAILFMTEGSGWTEVDGVRYDWRKWDAIHIPAWSWHRHGNAGDRMARFLSTSSEPLLWSLDLAILEDGGDMAFGELSPPPRSTELAPGDDLYSRRQQRLTEADAERRKARIHTDYDHVELQTNPKGTRSKFLNDASIGNRTSGLTQVMLQFAPGYGQSMHRHPGEAWLHVVSGKGHTYLGTEPEGGEVHEWEAGDLVVVDHYLWHQHFNDSEQEPARLVRIHAFASMLETMRALLDPLPLFEERLDTAPDVGAVDWPEDVRDDG